MVFASDLVGDTDMGIVDRRRKTVFQRRSCLVVCDRTFVCSYRPGVYNRHGLLPDLPTGRVLHVERRKFPNLSPTIRDLHWRNDPLNSKIHI